MVSMPAAVRPAGLSEVRAFVSAVELGSLAAAAERFRISQPALAKRVRALETLARTTLLERGPRGVVPTAAGRSIYDEGVRLLATASRFDAAIAQAATAGQALRLAAIFTVAESLAPAWLTALHHERPDATVEMRVGYARQVRAWVRAGEADIGLATGDATADPELEEIVARGDRLVVVVPPSHPFARRRGQAVPLATLVTAEMVGREEDSDIRRVFESALARCGHVAPHPALTLASTAAVRAAAIADRLVAVLPEPSVRSFLARGELVEIAVTPALDLTRTIRAIWRRDRPPGPLERRLLVFASQVDGVAVPRAPRPVAAGAPA